MLWILLIVVLWGGTLLSAAQDPLVTLEQGRLRGRTMESRRGRTIFAFQGLPFAAPPLGELRFQDPKAAPHWSGELVAQREGGDCAQTNFITNKYTGSEDCLYLNVYSPQLENAGLPVMVWVHGGGFFSGSGSTEMYGPELLLDNEVVLVTFNYRLGALGFLSLGTKELSGNYGLKDQVMALRWVQENIAKFGGNPDLVTIFGESAGAASVHYLMLSPLTAGLFHRAITQSGSALNPWAFSPDLTSPSHQLAAHLDCQEDEPTNLLNCLRAVPVQRLVEHATQLKVSLQQKTVFVPTLEAATTEGAFLVEEPRVLLARGDIRDVPLMTGLTTHEGMLSLFLFRNESAETQYEKAISKFVPSSALGLEPGTPSWNAIWDRIETFYDGIASGDFMECYLLLSSDTDFVLGVDELVRGFAALERSPVFFYQFAYEGGRGLLKKLANIKHPGTAHCDELPYMFTSVVTSPVETASQQDHLVIDRVTKLWTDFARYGNPTPDESLGVRWEPVAAKKGLPSRASTRFLNIEDGLQMVLSDLNGERVSFWRDLLEVRTPHTDTQRQEL